MLWSTSGDLFASFVAARSTLFSGPEINTIWDSILSLKRSPLGAFQVNMICRTGLRRVPGGTLLQVRSPNAPFELPLEPISSPLRILRYGIEVASRIPRKTPGLGDAEIRENSLRIGVERVVVFKDIPDSAPNLVCRKLLRRDGVALFPSRLFQSFDTIYFCFV